MNYKAFIFVLLYFVALLKPISPLIDYAINKDYIAKVLCINKDKPELQCNGKCHLMKELKNNSEDENEALPSIKIKDYPVGFINILKLNYQSPSQTTYALLNKGKTKSFISKTDHPPELII